MAILALASDLRDLRRRIGNVVLAYDLDGNPVTTEDLKVAGAMAVSMKEAIEPTLMQTLEGVPTLIHAYHLPISRTVTPRSLPMKSPPVWQTTP